MIITKTQINKKSTQVIKIINFQISKRFYPSGYPSGIMTLNNVYLKNVNTKLDIHNQMLAFIKFI